MFLIKSRDINVQVEILKWLVAKSLKLERRPPVYFVSFCPFQRAYIRKLKRVTVLNPFEWYHWGHLRNGLLWLDQWPSFSGDKWSELRYSLLGQHHILFLQQSISLKGENWLLKKLMAPSFDVGEFHTLYSDQGPLMELKLIPFQKLILQRYMGENKRGFLLLDETQWPKSAGKEVFIPQCIGKSSEVLALAHRNRVLLAASTRLGHWRLWSLPETVLAWLLAGQLGADLLNWLGANKSRRHSHSQDSLSGKTRHWHTSLKKWALHFSAFLWRPRRWQKAQGLNPRGRLHDESRAQSQPLYKRAS